MTNFDADVQLLLKAYSLNSPSASHADDVFGVRQVVRQF